MSLPRKALIVVSSAHAPMYPGDEETGVWITEALHPFETFKKAGFEVDFVSETGTYTPDWFSLQADWLKGEDKETYENTQSDFRQKLDSLKKASDVNASDYGILFASAGHAAVIDYPDAKDLHSIGTKIYSNGGVISAVCHGPAILPGIKDSTTGESVITGKSITGFTTAGEEQLGAIPALEKWGREPIETTAQRFGATYVPPPDVWAAFSHIDGRVVTGVNPQSSYKTAEDAVKVYETIVAA